MIDLNLLVKILVMAHYN